MSSATTQNSFRSARDGTPSAARTVRCGRLTTSSCLIRCGTAAFPHSSGRSWNRRFVRRSSSANATPGETRGFFSALKQRKALHGKTARIVATVQMPAFIYRWYFHPHLEKNTLRLSGMGRVTDSLIGLVEGPNPDRRERWLRRMHQLGAQGC